MGSTRKRGDETEEQEVAAVGFLPGDPTPEPPEPDTTPPEVTFTEPVQDAKIALGTNLTFKFTARDYEYGISSVEWSRDGTTYTKLTTAATGSYSVAFPVDSRGTHAVWVRAKDKSPDVAGGNVTVVSRSIVGHDPNPPGLFVDSPTAEITDAAVSLVARASVGHPGSGIKSVSWNLGGTVTGEATRQGDADGFSRWTASILLPSRKVPAGGTTYTLTVRATNLDNVARDVPVTFKAVDRTAPKLEVTKPYSDRTEVPGTIEGANVSLAGAASDGQDASKLYGDIQSVAWSLNGGSFSNVVPAKPGDWSTWTADVRIPARDEHLIVVRCLDAQGNESRVERRVVAALPFEVKDVGTRSYLKDLVDFATRRLKQSATGPYLDHRLLASTFHQPFADLVTSAGDKATRPVHQARVAVEVLREYLNPRPTAHWTFDEGSGTVAADASGNGVIGSLHGPVWGAGRLGQALRFDGVNDVVKLGKAGYADVVNNFTIAFWALPQATHENDAQATSGASGTTGQRYAIDPRQGGVLYGSPNHVCAGISVGTNGVGVYEHGDWYMPALLVHPTTLSTWTHVAVVYEEKTPKLYLNGTLLRTGLPSPKEYIHVNPEFLGGMNYGYYAGWLDDVRFYDRPLSAAEVANLVAPPPPAGEIVWVDDAVPPGAAAGATNDAWTWVTTAPAPYSGTSAHQSNAVAGMHQHYFENAPSGLSVARGDRLFAYVYIDPANKPEEIMLQWNDGTWEHRAFWGKDAIAWGTPGTESRRYMGPLPADSTWVRLEVAASQVGLENRVVKGMSFTLFGGRATWDRAGKVGAAATLAAAEAGYRRAAYETLLRRLGTSYEEIRLARGAEPATREALAARLGVRIGTVTPDPLDRLFFEPDKVTEASLERLFGLEETTRNPIDAAALPEPELLTWQRDLLRTQWRDADGARAEPLIDPDLIGPDDLRNRVASDPAFALWTERRAWVDGKIADLRTKRQSRPILLEGLDLIANEVLAPDTLVGMAADRERGLDLGKKLTGKGLSVPAFDALVRVRRLAAKGTVLPTEWEQVYAILAQAMKVRAYQGWVDAEKTRNIYLGPDHFVVREGRSSPPAWRASMVARQAWEWALHARLDQWHGTATALRDAVAATEAATLPLLRDALVAAAGAGRTDIDPAEALSRRLAIDLKTGGESLTTRVDQAVETLQGILFSLRAGQFKERTADLGPNPASTWVLEQRANYKEEQFDQEARWMGSYDAWRAAMFAFLYPENLLIPSLREDTTPGSSEKDPTDAFRTLVDTLRGTTGLTPARARAEAATYLAALLADGTVPEALKSAVRGTPPGWSRPFEITEQLDEAQLLARRPWLAGLWTNPALQTAQARTYLREVFYFVPVQLAIQLHQSGEYLAALDWLQTVYAYNLPPDQRKIYEPMALDPASPQAVNRTIEWLLNSLNPHHVALTRANAYTRFTLLSLARCFLDYADAEFARETEESLPRARALYMTVIDLLGSAALRPQEADLGSFPSNPAPQSLRLRAETNLLKLRTGRNFAGMQRPTELPSRDGSSALPAVVAGGGAGVPSRRSGLRPTPYYYAVLIERAKQLVAISQQVEAAYLSALERTDAENYGRLEAGHALDLAWTNVDLQRLREKEAASGEELATRQRARAEAEETGYQSWIAAGRLATEEALVQNYKDMRMYQNLIAGTDAAMTIAQNLSISANGGFMGTGLGFGTPLNAAVAIAAAAKAGLTMGLNNQQTHAQINSLRASQELREREWGLRRTLANKDVLIADQQIQIARDHLLVAKQESEIALAQADHARTVADFLANKFTNAELYEWMSGILGQVYAYFLRQATAVAQLAQIQLAFERQETPPSFIQEDYWQASSSRSNGATTHDEPDRRGLTGSARLLQDVYRLDQHAFETNKRKLQLTHTISLAQAYPFEFRRFRETGLLPFATPMELFDRAFPGHYLRLIRRVRTSVIALVPPTYGIKATLAASGLSRVVTADGFQTVEVRRDPELVALSAPIGATGLFELDPQQEMLLPFEGMGVDTLWEFAMPRAANPFDYRTVADVLVTIDYTALHSADYRHQVVGSLDPQIGADRTFSLREQFPDQWYDLLNPADPAAPLTVRFATAREDFPPNIDGDPAVTHLMVGLMPADGASPNTTVISLRLRQKQGTVEVGAAATRGGFINTRDPGVSWRWSGTVPIGDWEMTLDGSARSLFTEGKIEDLLFVVTYEGRTPAWTA